MIKPKKLIEVAMPVKEISAESVRDKSIRHGHISTLHLWWARRPLPVCRAVVFASLVPDPLDENCSVQFKEVVEILLGKGNDLPGDPYKPYDDIPHTAIVDKMEDNLRNRLMMFIGKFSDKYVLNDKIGKKTPTKDQLHQFSLIRWENKDNDKIIGRARKLIFVSHNADSGKTGKELLKEYDNLNKVIKKAEADLYNYPNRHIETEAVKVLEKEKNDAIAAFLASMPKVFDPFAGGGAIPLEAARLGCNSYGNDINPVAHIVQKGSCEFPQKYGKPINYSKDEFVKIYGKNELQKQYTAGNVFDVKVNVQNRLAFDVKYFAHKLINETENEIGYLYPRNKNDEKPIVYYWVRVGYCSNPTCKAEVPLLRQFYLSKRRSASSQEYVYFDPKIKGNLIQLDIKKGITDREPFIKRANLKCPVCGSITEVKKLKKQFTDKVTYEILAAVIEDTPNGKVFRKPFDYEIEILSKISKQEKPNELMPQNDSQNLKIPLWGFKTFGVMFSERQMTVMLAFVRNLHRIKNDCLNQNNYSNAIATYLAMLIDRLAMRFTTFNTWHIQQDTVEKIMGKQAIPMVFDYPEMNPFTQYTSSTKNQLNQIIDYIESESYLFNVAMCQNATSGDKYQFPSKYIHAVVTDPPYYDAIAYADLSDFFYIWLKRTIGNDFTFNFATPNTPKSDECTAIKHNHNGNKEVAKQHFEDKLLQIFDTIEIQTSDIVSIMFAHQSTTAWTTLCNSILGARMNITGSWAVDTEVTGGLKEGKAYLSSSVTVSCRPSQKMGLGDYKDVKETIKKTVSTEVFELYNLGFRGADLLTACFGKAVSVFGRYESVEKADGSEVTVSELLEMARESAFEAIVSDIDTDDITKFYIGWLNLFGFSEAIHDDVRRISQIGLSVDISDIYGQNILVKNGDKGILGSMIDRISNDKNLGLRPVKNYDIDIAQRMMYMFDPNNSSRAELLDFIADKAPNTESSIWRVLNSLAELLPKSKDINDQKLATGLLNNQENLIREARNREEASGIQSKLDFE